MKINKIELYNIGSYEGLNTFDISGQKLQGNISVIGGKNGAGKTTLFSGIKLCLYGCKESGYQAINKWYKNSIKKLINDKSKLEDNAHAYVMLELSVFNGQDWDNYQLKRTWNLSDNPFEEFKVVRNDIEMTSDEIDDFDNYLLNLIPPELFELYFFDGEQIADFFLEEGNGERIKRAFLTICGYDTFDILYKNFKRISRNSTTNDSALSEYFVAEETYRSSKENIRTCEINIENLDNSIEEIETQISGLEKHFTSHGGVSLEEWNKKFLVLKNEERIREEKNNWLKIAANEMLPYIILNQQLLSLQNRIITEEESSKSQILESALKDMLPQVFKDARSELPELSDELSEKLISLIADKVVLDNNKIEPILNLSKSEYEKLNSELALLLNFKANDIIDARRKIKSSIKRSQKCRAEIESSNISEVDNYLKEKESLLDKKDKLIEDRRALYELQKELSAKLSKDESVFKSAEKELEKHLKGESVSNLTTKSVLFLDALQKRLFRSEIEKVQALFMQKLNQLMRKKQFICDISIDEDFNIHAYKKVRVDVNGICKKINNSSIEAYIEEFGDVHCADILNVSQCNSFEEFLDKYSESTDIFEVVLELDKGTMSKGEKQVFIMALYWSIMQLCNKEIPFIIDTPFARIDTIHRAHITEYFFKELKGQVFIFSTDEEITQEHMDVIGDKLQSKFLIENIDNKKTLITANRYFEE